MGVDFLVSYVSPSRSGTLRKALRWLQKATLEGGHSCSPGGKHRSHGLLFTRETETCLEPRSPASRSEAAAISKHEVPRGRSCHLCTYFHRVLERNASPKRVYQFSQCRARICHLFKMSPRSCLLSSSFLTAQQRPGILGSGPFFFSFFLLLLSFYFDVVSGLQISCQNDTKNPGQPATGFPPSWHFVIFALVSSFCIFVFSSLNSCADVRTHTQAHTHTCCFPNPSNCRRALTCLSSNLASKSGQ